MFKKKKVIRKANVLMAEPEDELPDYEDEVVESVEEKKLEPEQKQKVLQVPVFLTSADMNKLVYELCAHRGYLRGKLAKALQIHRDTVYQWEKDYPKFSDSITKGMNDWNTTGIKKSLIVRAKGFRYTETTKEPNESGELKITQTVRKYVVPDVPAIKTWLYNRDPENWQDRRIHEVGGKDGAPIPIAAYPAEPLSLTEWEKQVTDAEEARKLQEAKRTEV